MTGIVLIQAYLVLFCVPFLFPMPLLYSVEQFSGFVMFPLVVHAFDLAISSIGWWTVAVRSLGTPQEGSAEHGTPLAILNRGFYTAGACSIVTFGISCRWLLWVDVAPDAWWHFYCCGLLGMVACYSSVLVSTYYTSTEYVLFIVHVATIPTVLLTSWSSDMQ